MSIQSIIKYSCFFLIFVLTIISCEDKIDIDLDPVTEQLVVDAWLTNQGGPQTIHLAMTQPYFNNTLPEGLTGATVTVTSSGGRIFEFEETEKGNYVWTPTPATGQTMGEVGTDYSLQITVDGQNYVSSSTMNRVPPIDSITYDFEEDERIVAEFFARDLPGVGDTYWIKTFRNGIFLNKPDEMNIAYDAGFSGNSVGDGLIFVIPIRQAINAYPDIPEYDEEAEEEEEEEEEEEKPWEIGDEIRVEIHSISNSAYLFLSSAQDQMTNGSNLLFYEPVINTTGNIFNEDGERVLGMFNVSAVSDMTTIIE